MMQVRHTYSHPKGYRTGAAFEVLPNRLLLPRLLLAGIQAVALAGGLWGFVVMVSRVVHSS